MPGVRPSTHQRTAVAAALGTASINNAVEEGTTAAIAMAWALIVLAMTALVLVGLRFSYHHSLVLRGFSSWPDPLFDRYQQARQNEGHTAPHSHTVPTTEPQSQRRARPPSQPQPKLQPLVGEAVGGAGDLASDASSDIEAGVGGSEAITATDQGVPDAAVESQGEGAGLELATIPPNRPREDSSSYDQVEV